ncbi:MAG TPA: 4Fe-4S binding protein [Patescibacteria group bacterium]|nr:4Fe-4S binding protein [Patescibacteria group bacterium]
MEIDITSQPGSTQKNKTGGWRTFYPETDQDKCIGCGLCAKMCPEGCIHMKKGKKGLKPQTDYDYCKGCGLCAAHCPVKAIKMKREEK